MEPTYSEWKNYIQSGNQSELLYCPYCDNSHAVMRVRYHTNRDGETEKQFRVECPICNHAGKVYLHESIAKMSWGVRENDPPKNPPIRRRPGEK